MQTISLIAAMDRNRGIGYEGKIPWHLPADFAHFKEVTMGHPVIMGRKTFESIGRPLPGRKNIVITSDAAYALPASPAGGDIEIASSLDDALEKAGDGEIFVIGGARVFAEALPRASRLFLTFVEGDFPADTYFPGWSDAQWRETARAAHAPDEKNPCPFIFVTLEKKEL